MHSSSAIKELDRTRTQLRPTFAKLTSQLFLFDDGSGEGGGKESRRALDPIDDERRRRLARGRITGGSQSTRALALSPRAQSTSPGHRCTPQKAPAKTDLKSGRRPRAGAVAHASERGTEGRKRPPLPPPCARAPAVPLSLSLLFSFEAMSKLEKGREKGGRESMFIQEPSARKISVEESHVE